MLENFPGSIKKQSKELKLTHTQKKYFIFQKEAIYAGAGTLQSPCYLNLVPRALFTSFGGGALTARPPLKPGKSALGTKLLLSLICVIPAQ